MTFSLPKINLDRYQLFTIFVLFWIGLGWLGLTLSLLSIFYKLIIVIYLIFGALSLVYILNFNSTKLKINYRFFVILFLTLGAILIFSTYSTPTIFSGRDQGSLSEAAIQLSQNHQISFSSPASQEFFKIYGPGKALNFPGFNYTDSGELSTQFPLGYISWLAIFYTLFGLSGFIIANSLTFFIFVFSFYLVTRYYLKPSSSILATLLVLTSFIFSWFFKFTLSENLALMLTWFGIYQFVLFTKDKSRFYLLASLASFILLIFTRVEALGFLAVIVAILLIKYKDWKYLFFVIIGKKIILLIGGFLLIYFFNLAFDSQSYTSMLKGILSPFISLGSGLKDYSQESSVSFFATSFYVGKVFYIYALFNFLLFGIVGFIYLWRKRKFEVLVPFLIVLPTFIYVIHPSISSDHPWMLRRFVFAVVPISILYSIWFFDHFFKKRFYFNFAIAILLITNLLVFLPYLTISPNKNLLPQIETLSQNFQASDLVLVDREATGDGWEMMTGPMNFLFHKQAVYFFNPQDLDKIDRSNFSNTYFIIPDKNLDFYQASGILSRITAIQDYAIDRENLAVQTGEKQEMFNAPIQLPVMQKNTVYGKIYLLTDY